MPTIQSRLRRTTAISTVAVLSIGGTLFVSLRGLREAEVKANALQALLIRAGELGGTTSEYLTHHEHHGFLRWRAQYDAITRLLDRVEEDGPEAIVVDETRQSHKAMGDAFDMMVASARQIRGAPGPASSETWSAPAVREMEAVLGGQVMMHGKAVASDLLRLSAHVREGMVSAQQRMAVVVGFSVLLLVAVNGGAHFTIMKGLVKPVDELRKGTVIVGAGNLDFRIGTRRKDEIGDLARSFDDMAENLQVARKELEAFSYSVSHDLRAPLRAVDGFSQILLDDHAAQLDSDGKRLLDVVRSSTQQMGRLVDDLLSFSRVGRQQMSRVPVDMKAVVELVLGDFASGDERVSCSVGALPSADGDPTLLKQVWVNLISNALKFTGPKSEHVVEIEGRTEAHRLVYSVKDNGVGFDMAYKNKLFGVFQRLHSTAEFEGTGVGLALVQRIVQRHGGEVWAEGKVGEGATFSFSLPHSGGSS